MQFHKMLAMLCVFFLSHAKKVHNTNVELIDDIFLALMLIASCLCELYQIDVIMSQILSYSLAILMPFNAIIPLLPSTTSHFLVY